MNQLLTKAVPVSHPPRQRYAHGNSASPDQPRKRKRSRLSQSSARAAARGSGRPPGAEKEIETSKAKSRLPPPAPRSTETVSPKGEAYADSRNAANVPMKPAAKCASPTQRACTMESAAGVRGAVQAAASAGALRCAQRRDSSSSCQ